MLFDAPIHFQRQAIGDASCKTLSPFAHLVDGSSVEWSGSRCDVPVAPLGRVRPELGLAQGEQLNLRDDWPWADSQVVGFSPGWQHYLVGGEAFPVLLEARVATV